MWRNTCQHSVKMLLLRCRTTLSVRVRSPEEAGSQGQPTCGLRRLTAPSPTPAQLAGQPLTSFPASAEGPVGPVAIVGGFNSRV